LISPNLWSARACQSKLECCSMQFAPREYVRTGEVENLPRSACQRSHIRSQHEGKSHGPIRSKSHHSHHRGWIIPRRSKHPFRRHGDHQRQRREQACRAATARHANGRWRIADPSICENDNSENEMELMRAMQRYKQTSGRMFPTWSEVLEVLKSLGYEKMGPDGG